METSLSGIPKWLLSGFRNAVAAIQISDNYKKYSLFLLPAVQQYSHTVLATESSTINFILVRYSWGEVFISTTKLFA